MNMIEDKALFTPTMAKVLESQGYLREAVQIYSHLLEQMPGHRAYRDKVEEIERRLTEEAARQDRLPALFDEWIALTLDLQRLQRLKNLNQRIEPSTDDGS
jgi:hypothetical protein